MILDRIGHLCDYILFDEAWAGFMKFHPLFAGHYAMGLDGLGPDDPGIIATQSTHKQLAGFSQAAQIHLKHRHIAGQPRHVTEQRHRLPAHRRSARRALGGCADQGPAGRAAVLAAAARRALARVHPGH